MNKNLSLSCPVSVLLLHVECAGLRLPVNSFLSKERIFMELNLGACIQEASSLSGLNLNGKVVDFELLL